MKIRGEIANTCLLPSEWSPKSLSWIERAFMECLHPLFTPASPSLWHPPTCTLHFSSRLHFLHLPKYGSFLGAFALLPGMPSQSPIWKIPPPSCGSGLSVCHCQQLSRSLPFALHSLLYATTASCTSFHHGPYCTDWQFPCMSLQLGCRILEGNVGVFFFFLFVVLSLA